jgi:hypothetical protein
MREIGKKIFIVFVVLTAGFFSLRHVSLAQTTDIPWSMAGANPQRTSWTSDTSITGQLNLDWYRTITPYIPPRFQIIAANDTLYISSAKGLYALTLAGAQKWVFPTEFPLGNSPTYVKEGTENMLYVGGQDHRLYKIQDNGSSYTLIWTFEMGINSTLDIANGEVPSGYDTNPLFININNIVYMGNRNGYVYAVNAANGSLVWKFKTNGRINFSIAASADNNIVYAVSNDTYAYALRASDGSITCTELSSRCWKSTKLPTGDGFQSWWPVIHVSGNALIISSSRAYGIGTNSRYNGPDPYEQGAKYDPGGTGGSGYSPNVATLPADNVSRLKDGGVSMSNAASYFNRMPYRQVYYLLNLSNGKFMFDTNGDEKPDYYPPLMNVGTNGGTRPPAILGRDPLTTANDLIYTFNKYVGDKYSNGIGGWKLTDPVNDPNRWNRVITAPSGESAGDEPMMYAASGNKIYWTQCCDRSAGYYDTVTGNVWNLFSYNLASLASGYASLINAPGDTEAGAINVFEPANDTNGIYGYHGDQNPPIPYKGRLYLHRSNTILAFGTSGSKTHLGTLPPPSAAVSTSAVNKDSLVKKLEVEVKKIIDAGHLRPGWGVLGTLGEESYNDVEKLNDYFHDPAITIYALSIAYSKIQDATLKTQLATYLQNEVSSYSPCSVSDIGWANGNPREDFTLPPEITSALTTAKTAGKSDFALYAMWKYAQNVKTGQSNAQAILNSCSSSPSTAMDSAYPFRGNARIAGYVGRCGLEKLANNTTTCSTSTQNTINSMMASRASSFNAANPWGGPSTSQSHQGMAIAENFMWMTPELANYLYTNAFNKINSALNNSFLNAPYWFVSKFEATYRENGVQHLYDNWALFPMKAWFASVGNQTSQEELAKYLDAPAYARGDLFYIQNLVTTIEAPTNGSSPTSTPTPSCGPKGDVDCSGHVNATDLAKLILKFGQSVDPATTREDVDGSGQVNSLDLAILLSNFGK